jgi:hypothetical protein
MNIEGKNYLIGGRSHDSDWKHTESRQRCHFANNCLSLHERHSWSFSHSDRSRFCVLIFESRIMKKMNQNCILLFFLCNEECDFFIEIIKVLNSQIIVTPIQPVWEIEQSNNRRLELQQGLRRLTQEDEVSFNIGFDIWERMELKSLKRRGNNSHKRSLIHEGIRIKWL